MQTQAHFEDIQPIILSQLAKAETQILVAVAWFTDAELFEVLRQKAKNGVAISVMLLQDKINNYLNFNELEKIGAIIIRIPVSDFDRNPMHNKFCVIDRKIVITGSYNWTVKAQKNDENITVTKHSESFADEYILEFQRLKQKYSGQKNENIDYSAIVKRLEMLKAAIALQDVEDIELQNKKLKKYLNLGEIVADLQNIVTSIETQKYGEASRLIAEFLEKHKALTIYVDSEIFGLRLEIKSLQLQISSLQDEKTDIEKIIHNFEQQYSLQVGHLLLQLLALRQEQAAKNAAKQPKNEKEQQRSEETRKEYEQYRQNFETEKSKPQPFAINEIDAQTLKRNYRKASKLCHPNAIAENQKAQAEAIFIKLKNAYDKNDLQTVTEILEYLENGKPLHNKHETISEKSQLQAEILHLSQELQILLQNIHSLKNSKTYQEVSEITDFEEYFETVREELRKEIEKMG
jgi:hypothetical protein